MNTKPFRNCPSDTRVELRREKSLVKFLNPSHFWFPVTLSRIVFTRIYPKVDYVEDVSLVSTVSVKNLTSHYHESL